MDAIELLKKDHAKVTELFKRFNDGGGLTGVVKRLTGNTASPGRRRTTAEQICRELDVHTRIEESLFYPAARELHDERIDGMLDEAAREHGAIKERFAEARDAAGDADLRVAVGKLQECVDHHVRDEESEMFPRLAELMPDAARVDLGRRLAAEKRRLAPVPAKKTTPKTPTRKPAARRAVAKPAHARGAKSAAKGRKAKPAKRRAGRR
jgi:hypothetical protein